jgi:hypothetical protein
MSQKLPETADEMLQISHVTKANFEKYGEGLLKICQQHAADKKGEILMLKLGNSIAYLAGQLTKQLVSHPGNETQSFNIIKSEVCHVTYSESVQSI